MSGWLDGWTRVDNPRSGGGTMDPENEGYPPRIVLHTIEGRGFGNVAGHQFPPHLWYNPATRQKVQTVPLNRSAFALYQGSDAPYYTNRARALQVELVGFAAEAGSWPDEHLVNIAQDVIVPLVEWVRAQGSDVDLSDRAVPLPGPIPNSAREDAPQRLAPIVWAFGPIGLCSHRHVPMGDDHWDTGLLDLRRIAGYARELLGSVGGGGTVTPGKPTTPPTAPASPLEDDEIMRQYRDVSTGTVYAVSGVWKTPLESDGVRQAWMQMGILLPPDRFFEQSPNVLAELETVDQGHLARIQAGVASVNASISTLLDRLGPLADAIAEAVVERTSAADLDGIRRVVRDELAALVLKAAA